MTYLREHDAYTREHERVTEVNACQAFLDAFDSANPAIEASSVIISMETHTSEEIAYDRTMRLKAKHYGLK